VLAQRVAGRSTISALLALPVTVALHVGISLLSATAFVRGLFTRSAIFVRTPKNGAEPPSDGGPCYAPPRDALSLAESVLALVSGYNAWLVLERGSLSLSSLGSFGLYALFAVSFAWVGFGSLRSRATRGVAPV
jgi:hypothetical protein